ncbi:hypothetical protein BDM02DRAFT_3186656 [Thelephora ganbajun]|uniref:Uncharacterized protein n=1 Tax=Thelephora ganbajun TaxID=370292 RepID=A0ACB6ZHJ2_THEGA|nr:hypothetical protein BDM02DRAFT_3186656 [Thelephora ganbajun]
MGMQAWAWYKQGRFEEAKSEVLRAADVYERFGAVKDLEGCRALLRDIEEEMKNPRKVVRSAQEDRVRFCEHYRKEAEEYDDEFGKKHDEDLNTALISIPSTDLEGDIVDCPYILPKNHPVGLPLSNSAELPPSSHSALAITGADGAASNAVPLEKVFGDLVATTGDRTPTFGAVYQVNDSQVTCSTVRSVEPLPIFKRNTLSNRVLVIGNSVSPFLIRLLSRPITPLPNAKYITQLLGSENAVLVEHQAVGHTTFAQYSTCTHGIVLKFLLDSQFTECAADSNDFFPNNVTNARRDYLWRK